MTIIRRSITATEFVNDNSLLSIGIVLNVNTSTKLADANPNRTMLIISNVSSTDYAAIKYQAASVDDDLKGIILKPKEVHYMNAMAVYTGEVCAIADTGTPTVYVTEY